MPSKINASVSSGLVVDSDLTGSLQLQTGGNPAISIDSSQVVNFTKQFQFGGVLPPTFHAFSSGSRTIPGNGTDTKVVLNSESWDTNSNFDSTTNYRFTPTVAGYYQINMTSTGTFASVSASGYLVVIIYKNGAAWSSGGYLTFVNGNYWQASHSNIVYLNGSTDYIEMYISTNNSGTYTQQNQGTTFGTFMSGALVRAA
jgi:hypothetical protein